MNDEQLIAELADAEAVLAVDPMRQGAYGRAANLRRIAADRRLDQWRLQTTKDVVLATMVRVFPAPPPGGT